MRAGADRFNTSPADDTKMNAGSVARSEDVRAVLEELIRLVHQRSDSDFAVVLLLVGDGCGAPLRSSSSACETRRHVLWGLEKKRYEFHVLELLQHPREGERPNSKEQDVRRNKWEFWKSCCDDVIDISNQIQTKAEFSEAMAVVDDACGWRAMDSEFGWKISGVIEDPYQARDV